MLDEAFAGAAGGRVHALTKTAAATTTLERNVTRPVDKRYRRGPSRELPVCPSGRLTANWPAEQTPVDEAPRSYYLSTDPNT